MKDLIIKEKEIHIQNIYICGIPHLYTMDDSISVRLPKEELKEVENILKYENATKSFVLREILKLGIKKKMLEIALDRFQKNEATAWKAATIANIPLTEFLDLLKERGIEFHYSLEELKEDAQDLF